MNIGFIGAGKAGFSLGQYLVAKGQTVVGYASKSPEPAQEAASLTKSAFFSDPAKLVAQADLIFITVPDGLIGEVWSTLADLPVKGKIFAHVSGSLSSEVFRGIQETGAYGLSLHPLMAIPDKYDSYKLLYETFFAIEGDEPALSQVMGLVASWGNEVQPLDKSKKALYHCAASIVSNFTVALAFTGAALLESCGLSEAKQALFRLTLNNARSIFEYGPVAALTGPVERGDVATVAGHLAVLSPEDQELYKLLAKKLLKVASLKRPDKDYAPLAELLA
ncbi:MAG: DUF2520 domain-containing protein [Deltaproteobacteria bacterium]|jgi:predicted short-subunit dehydrogenase-like oxidoreductase (DUF2520 family)|nr:DUF2520 domain-containing protein [Deltaproteobacteria bacterium]